MAIGEAWRAWRRGDGFEKSVGYLWLSQEDIDNNRDTTSRLDEVNRKAFDAGKLSEQDYLDRTARNHTTEIGSLVADPASSPWGGFKEGLKEGVENVQGAIKETIRAPITFGLGAIPWQAWVILLIWGAWRLGLMKKLLKGNES